MTLHHHCHHYHVPFKHVQLHPLRVKHNLLIKHIKFIILVSIQVKFKFQPPKNCLVYGSGYAWSNTNLVIKSGDTEAWSWSPPSLVTGVSYQVIQVIDVASTKNVTNGFSSGIPKSKGNSQMRLE